MKRFRGRLWEEFLGRLGYCSRNTEGDRPCDTGGRCTRCGSKEAVVEFDIWMTERSG